MRHSDIFIVSILLLAVTFLTCCESKQLDSDRDASISNAPISSTIPVNQVIIEQENIELKVGENIILKATVLPENATDKTVRWSSSNNNVLRVSDDGNAVALATGTAVVTATAGNKSDDITVVVSSPTVNVNRIYLDKTEIALKVGTSETLTATITPSNATNKNVSWTSSNVSVATVNQGGRITAISKGTVTITASAKDGSGKTASCTVSAFSFTSPIDISANGRANCYIVSAAGTYSFPATKGNSSESVGPVASAEVLWESFGTSVKPSVSDVVYAEYKSGRIIFETPSSLHNGNAVIAAKDADDNIIWSWHIWVCKGYNPVATGQVYYNNAGTMMDRNLGATSATPGDVGALGLLYQWGRKDPFLGSCQISYDSIYSQAKRAASTLSSWPSPVTSDNSNGTIDYAVKNPTTFIKSNSSYGDWFSSTDDTRWQSTKTIYDPCPPGWRVPDGGSNGVWAKAVNISSSFNYNWNDTEKGINFSGKFGSAETIWYPAAGYLNPLDGYLYQVGSHGSWWACTISFGANELVLLSDSVHPGGGASHRTYGYSVRCQKEE